MPELTDKRIIIIAGPNGAGKTTFALEYLPNEAGCPLFVNADLIADGLSPFDPSVVAVRAGRLMLEEINRHARMGASFAFETTLAGRRYAQQIPRWQRGGYRVHLIFLRLRYEALAVERVAVRVAQGGHSVPEEIIRRRFKQGLRNFQNISRKVGSHEEKKRRQQQWKTQRRGIRFAARWAAGSRPGRKNGHTSGYL